MPLYSIRFVGSGKCKAGMLPIISKSEMRNSCPTRLRSNQGATWSSHVAHMSQSCGNDELHNARFESSLSSEECMIASPLAR